MKLLTPSVPPAGPPESGPAETADAEPESRGGTAPESAAPAPKKRRRKRAAQAAETAKCGLYLTDDVQERLRQTALQRKTTISAVANELLARHLPEWEVKRKVS
jgi:hypothetical protein